MLKKINNYISSVSHEDFNIGVHNLHIAFLCSNNRIYFFGVNSSRTKVSSINYLYKSLHAEIDAIRQYKASNLKKKMDIYVVRLSKNNKCLFSKPCENCMDFLKKETFLKNIYYYNQNNFSKIK